MHGLIACGGEDGFLECFDLRQKTSLGRILAVGAGNGDQVGQFKTLFFLGIRLPEHFVFLFFLVFVFVFVLWSYWLYGSISSLDMSDISMD